MINNMSDGNNFVQYTVLGACLGVVASTHFAIIEKTSLSRNWDQNEL